MKFLVQGALCVLLLAQPAAAVGAPAVEEAPPADAGAKEDFDPVRLGMSSEALGARFGDALRAAAITRTKSAMDLAFGRMAKRRAGEEPAPGVPAAETLNPYAEQIRYERKITGEDVIRAEYDLFRDKVYAIRWQLAERFERPIAPDLVEKAVARLGKPKYDQFIPVKFGSGKVDMRRSGWIRDGQLLEVRVLAPKTGGPVYITAKDRKALKAIIESRGQFAPDPDTLGPWWERPAREYKPVTAAERAALVGAFDALLDQAVLRERAREEKTPEEKSAKSEHPGD